MSSDERIMKEVLHQQRIGAHIVLLEIDNGQANTLSSFVKSSLLLKLEALENDASIRTLILTSRSGHFCCGDDLKEAKNRIENQKAIYANLLDFDHVIGKLEQLPFITIAAISGYAFGGGLELALSCDIRIAAEDASFKAAGVNMGLTASADKLARILGISRAKYYLFTAEEFSAQQASDFGMVTKIYPKEHLLQCTIETAQLISSKAPLSLRATKEIANKSLHVDPKALRLLNSEWMHQLAKSKDHQEAVNAFVEKRKPIFKGD